MKFMKKSPTPAPPVETGLERHQYILFVSRKDIDEFNSKGGSLSSFLIETYGVIAFLFEKIQDDEQGVAYHAFCDYPLGDT